MVLALALANNDSTPKLILRPVFRLHHMGETKTMLLSRANAVVYTPR